MPIVYVYSKKNFEILRIEESFSSLVWTERYQSTGDFVLDIPLSKANIDVYRRGNYLTTDESKEWMMIESVEINEEQEDPVLEIKGRSLALILERRINASRLLENYASSIAYTGSLQTVVQSIIDSEMISPTMQEYKWQHRDEEGNIKDGYGGTGAVSRWKQIYTVNAPYRKLSNISYQNLVTEAIDVDKTFTKLMTVYDILEIFAKAYVFGFRVRLDSSGNFVLQTYKGSDRTSAQKVLDPVIFNPVMDNISYVNYFEDQTDYRNVGLSYSDGSFSPVEFNASFPTDIFNGYIWVTNDEEKTNNSITGLDRMEVPFDARSNASVQNYDPSGYLYPDIGEEPEKNIVEKVTSYGEEQFDSGDYDFIKTSEGAIDPLVRYTFGEDYFLGDIVELSNDNGVIMTAIIDEVVKSYDADGFVVTPNFKSMEDYDYGEEDTE